MERFLLFKVNINMNKKTFIKQLDRLVSFKTLAGDRKQNSQALDYVESLVGDGIVKDRLSNGGAEVLILSVNKTKSPEYCYLVHIDVVAGRDDQFVMKEEGDRLMGRGTCDMKFSIPIGVALLNEAIDNNVDFSLVVTTDEEIGGLEGAKFLRENYKYAPKMLIVPDGGENLNFVDKAKGVCQMKIVAKGTPAHASRPWLGRNALEGIAELAHKLSKEYKDNNKKEAWVTTMNIGTINGGISTNQVCPLAEMKVDFRYPENDSIEAITKKVESYAKDIEGDFEISLIGSGLPTFTDASDERVVRYIKVMSDIFETDIKVKSTYGASDARHFADLKIPVLMHKPIGGEIHSDNEWVSVDSSLKFYEGLRNYLGLK